MKIIKDKNEKEETAQVQPQISSSLKHVSKMMTMEDMAHELDDRQRRAKNLVFVGLSEGDDPKRSVINFCATNLSSPLGEDAVIKAWKTKPKENGKKPLIIAIFKNTEIRDKILESAKRRPRQVQQGSWVFVNPDLTVLQRETARLTRERSRQIGDSKPRVTQKRDGTSTTHSASQSA